LIRRPSKHSSGDRLVESDSDKTFGFSARKTCITKRRRQSISDEPGGARHQTVDCWFIARNKGKADDLMTREINCRRAVSSKPAIALSSSPYAQFGLFLLITVGLMLERANCRHNPTTKER
jgi:hypothetical protein